ncbi:hypothetical protein [Prevotella pectinovora]|uniref:hypothetical protein n=1 Tax=Prevotella pectinovora TaxID=1602169 RepID=UPI003A92F296
MKSNRLTLSVSVIAIVLSVIAISTSFPRTEMSFDYLGFITGCLGFLVTVLLGWNIYTIFDFRQERQDLKTYFDEQKQSVKAVGSDLRMTFMNQIANVSLLEKHISDVYSYLMGINKTVPLYFYYIHLTLGAIINSAQSENYDNCNVWVNELLAVIKEPEVIEMPITSKMSLLKSFTMICHSENIKRLDELHSVIARLKGIPDPEAKEMYGS